MYGKELVKEKCISKLYIYEIISYLIIFDNIIEQCEHLQ